MDKINADVIMHWFHIDGINTDMKVHIDRINEYLDFNVCIQIFDV